MTRAILSVIFYFQLSAVFSQSITLEQAVQRGLENRIELKAQDLNVQIASTENEKVKARWLPQVNGSADIRWNTQLQTTVLPFALPGSGESQTEIKLGRPFNNTFALQADQKVYDANRKVDRAVNNTQVEAQKKTLDQIRINLKQAITEAYYNCVFAKERLNLSVL